MINQLYSQALNEKIAQWEKDFSVWAATRGLVSMVDWVRANGAPSADPTGETGRRFAAQQIRNRELSTALRTEYAAINAYPVKEQRS